ncbi:MAG: hypothetical protein QXH35_08605 [Nitrososphaerota archaeon]
MRLNSAVLVGFLVVAVVSSLVLGMILSPYIMTAPRVLRVVETKEVRVTVERTVTISHTSTITSTREETVTQITTITVTERFPKFNETVDSRCAVLKTDKDVYRVSERVTIILENRCEYTLILPNSAPWLIKDATGEIVFSPFAAQVITELGPGGRDRWSWDQKDNLGVQASPGKFYVELRSINAGTLVAEFIIV